VEEDEDPQAEAAERVYSLRGARERGVVAARATGGMLANAFVDRLAQTGRLCA
jgi:hypothetical protein